MSIIPDCAGAEGDVCDIVVYQGALRLFGISSKLNNYQTSHPRIAETGTFYYRCGAPAEIVTKALEELAALSKSEWWETHKGAPYSVLDESVDANGALIGTGEKPELYRLVCDSIMMVIREADPEALFRTLVGSVDFYKLILDNRGPHPTFSIEVWNIYGSLPGPKVKTPTTIDRVEYVPGRYNTFVIQMGNWTFSVRVHNGDSRIKGSQSWKLSIEVVSGPTKPNELRRYVRDLFRLPVWR